MTCGYKGRFVALSAIRKIQAVRVVEEKRDRRQLGSAALNWCTARVMMSQNDPKNDHGLG